MGSEKTLTKYCNNSEYGYNGFTDGLTELLPEDDAATQAWGDEWQTPSAILKLARMQIPAKLTVVIFSTLR